VTGTQVLLALRLVEISYMMVCLFWIVGSPYSRLRTLRLWACYVLIIFNLAAIVVAVAWLKVDLW